MKRMKKILAMLLALTMIVGMGLTSMAAENVPDGTQTTPVTVAGVEPGAVVKAYQVVKGKYNENGLVDYVVVESLGDKIANAKAPKSDEITDIAKDLTGLTSKDLTNNNGTCKANLEAGYWVVVVTADEGKVLTDVYNPILVGVWYSKSGSDLDMAFGPVSADDDWDLVTENAYAKHSVIDIRKTVSDTEAAVGEDVTFTVKTHMPSYSAQYAGGEGALYVIKDEIQNGLAYNKDIKVVVGNVKLEDGKDYNVKYVEAVDATETTEATNAYFEIEFTNDFVLNAASTMTDRAVLLTYSAKVTETAEKHVAAHNIVTVTYETQPGKTNSKTDEEYVYTFAFDIDKVDATNTTKVLKDAEFTLYADEEMETVVDVYTTLEDGKIKFDGLDADKAYYLKETNAPDGYSINENLYKVTFEVTSEKDAQYTYTFTVVDNGTNAPVINIPNTTLVSLPSTGGIGTTIFTVAGCGIMIAAAFFFFASRKKEN